MIALLSALELQASQFTTADFAGACRATRLRLSESADVITVGNLLRKIRQFEYCIAKQLAVGSVFTMLLVAICPVDGYATQTSQVRPQQSDQADLDDEPAIDSLVGQLGAGDFETRNAAEDKLIARGEAAVERLTGARMSQDSETRFRANRILALIEKAALARRLELLVSSDPSDHERFDSRPLDGWQEFASIAGRSADSRELFARIFELSPTLFEEIRDGVWVPDLKNPQTEILFRGTGMSIDSFFKSVTSAFLLSIAEPVADDNAFQQTEIRRFQIATTFDRLNDPNLRAYVDSTGYRRVFTSVAANWISGMNTGDPVIAKKIVDAVNNARLENCSATLVEFSVNENFDARFRASAIRTVCLTGTATDVALLNPLIDCNRHVGFFPVNNNLARSNPDRIEIVDGIASVAGPDYPSGQAKSTQDLRGTSDPGATLETADPTDRYDSSSEVSDRRGQQVEVLLGDVALLAAIVLSHKQPFEFGFESFAGSITPDDNMQLEHQLREFPLSRAGFTTAAARGIARKQWGSFYLETGNE